MVVGIVGLFHASLVVGFFLRVSISESSTSLFWSWERMMFTNGDVIFSDGNCGLKLQLDRLSPSRLISLGVLVDSWSV